MIRAVPLALVLAAALAQPAVPPLTGRVVDRADVLDAYTEAAITALLADHEDATGNQVAVLTLPSLDGAAIEPVATDIFRAWALGEADRDNGVLLLVAVADRELRIEVGYGLEGALPDAVAAAIIRTDIVPAFRRGDFDGGVLAGATAIVAAIDGEYVARDGPAPLTPLEAALVFLALIAFPVAFTTAGVVNMGGPGRSGTLVALGLGAAGGLFGAFGTLRLTGSVASAWQVLAGFVLAAAVLDAWIERHPAYGATRRLGAAKAAAFRRARASGASSVTVGGRRYSVPSRSGGSSFGGGGGSSGGGGASGSW